MKVPHCTLKEALNPEPNFLETVVAGARRGSKNRTYEVIQVLGRALGGGPWIIAGRPWTKNPSGLEIRI